MIAEYHLRGWLRIPEVEIVALCDPDRARAQSRQQEFVPAAAYYADVGDLLAREKLDFIDILTPPWLHKEHCLRAAEAGLHIICQKPLCGDLGEAEQLVAALREYPKIFAVHENHPYRPWFRDILELKQESFFGAIRHVALIQHDAHEPPERFKAEAERGIMLEYGVHLVDMLRALVGEPRQVFASMQRVNPRVRGESLATALYLCEGASGLIDISWKSTAPELGSATVIGERGIAVYDGRMTRGKESRFRLFQEGRLVLDEVRCPTDDFCESFYLLQRELTDAMLRGTPPPQPASYNLQTLAATFAAYDVATLSAVPCLPQEEYPQQDSNLQPLAPEANALSS
jgi:predicted dehydrogenase